jgi:hypothetical protein
MVFSITENGHTRTRGTAKIRGKCKTKHTLSYVNGFIAFKNILF